MTKFEKIVEKHRNLKAKLQDASGVSVASIEAFIEQTRRDAAEVAFVEDRDDIADILLYWHTYLVGKTLPLPEISLTPVDCPSREEAGIYRLDSLDERLGITNLDPLLDAPLAVRDAYDDLRELASKDLVHAGSTLGEPYYNLIICTDGYPKRTRDSQVNIAERVRRILNPLSPRRRAPMPHYDAILTDFASRMHKEIYVFTYYSTLERRRFRGVLPYCMQRQMSLLIRKDHPAFVSDTFASMDKALKSKDSDSETATHEAQEWLMSVVEHTAFSNGSVYSFSGYIFTEMLSQIVQECTVQSDHPRDLKQWHRQSSIVPWNRIAVKELLQRRFSSEDKAHASNVLLLDPLDRRMALDWIKESDLDYRLVDIPHGLRVPTGLGFTLWLLPDLMAEGRLAKLREALLRHVSGLKSELETLGMELTAEFTAVRDAEAPACPAHPGTWYKIHERQPPDGSGDSDVESGDALKKLGQ